MNARIEAIATLEALGCTLLLADSRTPTGNTSTSTPQPTTAETYAMHCHPDGFRGRARGWH